MRHSRRSFMAGSTAAIAGLALPQSIIAQTQLGSATLSTLSDGHLVLPPEFIFAPMPQDELPKVLAPFGMAGDRLEPECNLAIYRDEARTVLFDVGSGPDFMPTAGALIDSMDAAGLTPDDVTDVVFTHAHPDHIWGLLDDFDEPLFPDATYHMGRTEWDYWWNPETVNTIGEARAAFAVGAKRRMEAIEDSVVFFGDGDEVLPGISAIACHGHTPGHMAFEVRQGTQAVLVVGDAIGNHHVAFARPAWESGSDQDPATAVQSRLRLLDRLANEQMQVVGFHLPGGGMGRVEKAVDRFTFIPEKA